MARWTRALGWLPPDARRILDAGCAFGFTTVRAERVLGARRPLIVGVELDPGYLAQARRCVPRLRLIRGSVDALSLSAEAFDAVLFLDVLEHLPADVRPLEEIARVLRPSGALILSVPHAGPLARLDSLNLYSGLRERLPRLPPLDPTERGFPRHRHYSIGELRSLLEPHFRMTRVKRTGLGLAEPLNLALMLLARGLLRSERLYRALRYLYFTAYLVEDLIPTGRFGYHLMLSARKDAGRAPCEGGQSVSSLSAPVTWSG
jgi:SAM-dependent methyltransferase